ncbi:hypothetical protein PHMEG_00029588 [Phytophthora megakarya]|uniref:Uncharacterized protein n=1 Tax=Phytophthora megakarya TaxID=4795 RepID=A0A225V4S6_9STRA|nr:hypothetical protein PHMEG_00029588 [Phytophthora megakarya]
MNVVIKSHQEMYDRLKNRLQLAHRSNGILTKEENHARSEYLLMSLTAPTDTTLTLKLREHHRDLVRRVKRLEKDTSALGSRLRLEDMVPEALVLMVDNRDSLADDIARANVRFSDIRAEKLHKAEEAAAAAGLPVPSPLTVSSQASTASPAPSPPASTPPTRPVSGGKKGKGKAKRQRTGSDNEDVDFGGGNSGDDAPEGGREYSKQKASPRTIPPVWAKKSQASPKSSSGKPSVPAPVHNKAGPAPKKIDVAVSDTESILSSRFTPKRKGAMGSEFRPSFRLAGGSRSDIKSLTSESSNCQSVKSLSSKSTKSRSKKSGTKATSGFSSSDESKALKLTKDEDSELSKLRPENQCLEDSLDGVLGTLAPKNPLVKNSDDEGTASPKAKPLPATKADSKTLLKDKMKASPKSVEKKRSSAKPKKLVKLVQRASDLLTPYVAPEFTTASAQKCWVKFEQAFLPSPVPSDAEVNCTTVSIEMVCNWRRVRGYGNKKSTVMSFAIYERKHWVSPEAVKRLFSRMTARLGTIKDPKERRQFKLALENLKKVWFTYNMERADRADNLRTFPYWPHVTLMYASLSIETLLDPTLPFYIMENLM